MSRHAAITIRRPRNEVRELWESSDLAFESVTFADAPGDRGTEIHVDVDESGRLAELAGKLTGSDPLAEAKDELRRFKQVAETGEIARSDGTPEGELAKRKLKQRPAQPLEESELDKAGA
jgi:uncharacterized membrane protein